MKPITIFLIPCLTNKLGAIVQNKMSTVKVSSYLELFFVHPFRSAIVIFIILLHLSNLLLSLHRILVPFNLPLTAKRKTFHQA